MIIHIFVKPKSSITELTKISNNEYIAKINAPAEDNKANIALIKLICKEFNVSYKKVKIVNPRSRKKIIEILDDAF